MSHLEVTNYFVSLELDVQGTVNFINSYLLVYSI